MPRPIKRHKRNIGKRVECINQHSAYYGRVGTLMGFRGDQSPGNPYCQVLFHQIETISAKSLRYHEP